ncbi:MAG: hypothetical protein V2I33_14820 [Kangiellaceae bacterium]|jgi:hypothetical protein|nr:hypothetical protein [Kangiellaceae bacterium]
MRFSTLVLLLFSCLVASSQAKNIKEYLPADGVELLYLENMRGAVVIKGVNPGDKRAAITVEGKVDSAADDVVFNAIGKRAEFKVVMPKNRQFYNKKASKLVVEVPNNIELVVVGTSTQYDIENFSGKVKVTSVSGNVVVKNVAAGANISNVSGLTQVSDTGGTLILSTVNGKVTAQTQASTINIRSISADVSLKVSDNKSINASNVSGETLVSGTFAAKHAISLSSVSGEIALSFEQAANASFYLTAGPGGAIETELTSKKPLSSIVNDQKLEFVAGDGGGEVTISTLNGTITVN